MCRSVIPCVPLCKFSLVTRRNTEDTQRTTEEEITKLNTYLSAVHRVPVYHFWFQVLQALQQYL